MLYKRIQGKRALKSIGQNTYVEYFTTIVVVLTSFVLLALLVSALFGFLYLVSGVNGSFSERVINF